LHHVRAALSVITLSGAAIYLVALGFMLLARWVVVGGDFWVQHGEPFLVFGFAAATGIHAINIARKIK
jgi:hypothetical protein